MNRRLLALRGALMLSRAMVVCTGAATVGAGVALWVFSFSVQAQTQTERIIRQEVRAEASEARILRLESEADRRERLIAELTGQIRTMQGIGMGLGGLIMLGQLIQVFVGREIRKIKE